MISYENQLNYLLQEELKIKDQINGIKRSYTNGKWKLESFEFYENRTSCDYPNCPHGTVSNGIKNVCRVIDRNTGEQLNLGANCYIKLFRNISELDTEQKKEAQTLTTALKKEKSKLEEIYEKKEMFVRDIMVSLQSVRNQLESLNIPMNEDFSSYLEVTEEKELIRIVKILDDALRKYQIELNKLTEISKNKESNTRINKSEDDGSVADFWRNFNRKKRNNY